MRTSSRLLLASTTLLAIAGAYGLAGAQQMPQRGWMGHQGMMDCPMMGGMGHHRMGGDMGWSGMGRGPMMMGSPANVEGRLAYLKAELGITEPQTKAWDGYVSAVKSRMSTMHGMHDSMMQAMQAGTATARLDAHVKHMEAMTEALKSLKPATDALYAVLTTEQKAKADVLLGIGCCMM